jgi:hypothetical protein
MKCKDCKKEIEGPGKYLAYYADGTPVYWNRCEACIKKMWLEFKAKFLSQPE